MIGRSLRAVVAAGLLLGSLAAFAALLISPISWSHHWVWCVPMIAEGRPRTAAALVLVFTARSLWLVPHAGDLDLRLPLWQQPLASPYALVALAVVAFRARAAVANSQLPARSSSASMIR
ncbi:hypothetical protein ACFV98_14320 [Streptomyces violascens]|uniref:hypothetical protein n=1 Tax=Streptomyces violascens TaxID=67381 RepID=UPI00364FB62F